MIVLKNLGSLLICSFANSPSLFPLHQEQYPCLEGLQWRKRQRKALLAKLGTDRTRSPCPWLPCPDSCPRTPLVISFTFQCVLFSVITAFSFSASCCSCFNLFRDSWNFSWKKHIESTRVQLNCFSAQTWNEWDRDYADIRRRLCCPGMKNREGQSTFYNQRMETNGNRLILFPPGERTWPWNTLSPILSLPTFPPHSIHPDPYLPPAASSALELNLSNKKEAMFLLLAKVAFSRFIPLVARED